MFNVDISKKNMERLQKHKDSSGSSLKAIINEVLHLHYTREENGKN